MITDKVDLSTNQRCDCGLSQIIRLNVITFSALLNDGDCEKKSVNKILL